MNLRLHVARKWLWTHRQYINPGQSDLHVIWLGCVCVMYSRTVHARDWVEYMILSRERG